jgi:glucose-induced degradation protein 8
MNYLVVEGFQEAAEMFHKESNTPSMVVLKLKKKAEIDLSTITERVSIRNSIQNGNIQEAIEKVNDLNPEVYKKKLSN